MEERRRAHIPEGRIDAVHARGRGAQVNPANRIEHISLTVLGYHLDDQLRDGEGERRIATNVYIDSAKTVINKVTSPDVGMEWTVNPYRGCEHGCVYCYARPTHETFGLSSGLDFESKLFAKVNAPELLRRELAKPSWRGETIVMSGITDPYQPIEKRLRITRGCLEVMAECRQPVGVITKNSLVRRDIDVLSSMAADGCAGVYVSVTSLDNRIASSMEPRASSPSARLETIRALADAGVPVTAMVAPVVPGLTDREVPAILKACAEAGATSASWVMLRLPWGVKDVFTDWLAREFPERGPKVIGLIRDMRGGEMYRSETGERMRGTGAVAAQIAQMFDLWKRRLGLDRECMGSLENRAEFRRPSLDGQMGLFDGGR
ncbi:MAG: PA0069 family radical SAM protein [Phycisphaerales bacterium]